MSRVDQAAVTTFAEVLSTAGITYHLSPAEPSDNDGQPPYDLFPGDEGLHP